MSRNELIAFIVAVTGLVAILLGVTQCERDSRAAKAQCLMSQTESSRCERIF